MKKKTELKGAVNFVVVVDFNPIGTNDILNIHKYLMKRMWYKIIFGLINKIFFWVLLKIVSPSNHTNFVSLSN